MAVSIVWLMQCPYGHDATPIKLDRKRYDYNQHYDYVQCSECKRVFIHEVTMVSFSSEVDDMVFARQPFDEGWHEEKGAWVGPEIVFMVGHKTE